MPATLRLCGLLRTDIANTCNKQQTCFQKTVILVTYFRLIPFLQQSRTEKKQMLNSDSYVQL